MPKKNVSIGGNKKRSKIVDLRSGASGRKKSPSSVSRPRSKPAKRPVKKSEAMASFTKSGSKRDYSKIQRRPKKKSSGLLTFLIVLLVLLVGAAMASFFIFGSGGSSQSLKLAFATPKNIASGENVILEVTYENLDKISLENIELVIHYPEGFYFDSSNIEPSNQEKNQWQLEPLEVGQSGKVRVEGQLVGKIKEEKEFTVVLHFQPANFHSDFMEEISKKIKIDDALLDVSIEAPEQIEDGQEVSFKVKYENKKKEDIKDVYFGFELAEGFEATYLSPTTTEYTWLIEEILAKQDNKIELSGLVDSSETNPLPWLFRVWQMVEKDGQPQERVLFQESGEVKIIAPRLEIEVAPLNPDKNLNWGEEVDFKITYKNSGELDVSEAVLKLSLSDLVDWSRYNNVTGATRDNNILIWLSKSGQAAKGLSDISQGDEKDLIVTVPLINEPDELTDFLPNELMVEAQAFISVKFNDEDKVFASEVFASPIASQARLLTEARYYLDAYSKVGSGPLPPVIGQETTYRIYWKVFSGSNGLKNIKIKTSLPSYIDWEGEVDSPTLGSSLEFDESSKQVAWEINEVGANAQLMASFDISVIPSESQVNQLLILSNPTSFTAEEKSTKAVISSTNDLLTSELLGDSIAQGEGRVKVSP